jgi:signal peptide peptidase SppA
MKYARIVAEVCSRAWAMREETVWQMQNLLRLQAEGVKWSVEEIRERIAASNLASGYVPRKRGGARFLSPGTQAFDQELEMEAASGRRSKAAPGSVALIPVMGVIAHRMSSLDISGPGGTSIQQLTADFRQALGDGNCKAIVFDVDSPGGSVEGVMELAGEIYDARKQKPITAVCNSMACSAAYWLAAAANEVVCMPSGQCGSIGVYMLHQDESEALKKDGIKITIIKAGKFKAEGNPSEPLSPEAYDAFLGKVNDYYGMFVKAIAQYRGTSQAAVREGYGQGRSLLANDAVKQGLADRVGTLDDVLQKHGVKSGPQSSASGSQPGTGARAGKPDDEDEDEDGPCGCSCKACEGCENKAAGAHVRADGDMSCRCDCEACKACSNKASASASGRQPRAEDPAPAAEPEKAEPAADDEPCDCNCAVCQGCEYKTSETPESRTGIQPDSSTVCECSCETCKACVNKTGASAETIRQTAAKEESARAAAGAALAMKRRRRQLALM